MVHSFVIIWLVLCTLFAAVHLFAIQAALYWYHWWFDIVMHFWGGLLVGGGVYALCTFRRISITPSLWLVVVVLLGITGVWEVFERLVGLYNPDTYLFDTSKDILVGCSGGLLAHLVLRNYTIG